LLYFLITNLKIKNKIITTAKELLFNLVIENQKIINNGSGSDIDLIGILDKFMRINSDLLHDLWQIKSDSYPLEATKLEEQEFLFKQYILNNFKL
jgi:hypothetical protein